MANWYQDQLTNKNFLSPIGFVFILEKARNVSFLCQKAEIPPISLGQVDILLEVSASYTIRRKCKLR